MTPEQIDEKARLLFLKREPAGHWDAIDEIERVEWRRRAQMMTDKEIVERLLPFFSVQQSTIKNYCEAGEVFWTLREDIPIGDRDKELEKALRDRIQMSGCGS